MMLLKLLQDICWPFTAHQCTTAQWLKIAVLEHLNVCLLSFCLKISSETPPSPSAVFPLQSHPYHQELADHLVLRTTNCMDWVLFSGIRFFIWKRFIHEVTIWFLFSSRRKKPCQRKPHLWWLQLSNWDAVVHLQPRSCLFVDLWFAR